MPKLLQPPTTRSAEVDQSGKIERTNTSTVLALANGACRAILISARTKRQVMTRLEARRRADGSKAALLLRFFAAATFLLIEPELERLDRITLDIEYQGHEAELRGMILELIRRSRPDVESSRIAFGYVGKNSPAHHLAWRVHRGEKAPDRVLESEEILRLL